MTWSLLNYSKAVDVKALLDEIEKSNEGRPEFTPAMKRVQAESIIHSVLWAMACRESDFAAAYAMENFANAVGEDLAKWVVGHLDFQKRTSAPPADVV